jgi:hypothetical protein
MRIGIVGVPPRALIDKYRAQGGEVVDLDMPQPGVRRDAAEAYVPRVYCATLRTVAANALSLELDIIVAAVGEGKCDGARFIMGQLAGIIETPILAVRESDEAPRGFPICTSDLPLREKMDLIIKGVAGEEASAASAPIKPCKPTVGFWGVPPHDFSILDLFPNTTHIFGWTRCMENGTPADLELETALEPDLPTVFFAQAFCAKNSLARSLATKFNGLYVEVDEAMTRSAAAKVSAFLELGVKR